MHQENNDGSVSVPAVATTLGSNVIINVKSDAGIASPSIAAGMRNKAVNFTSSQPQ